ncbi:hypothetical protein E4T56_gene14073, partial [Termitomyces sp. T112]
MSASRAIEWIRECVIIRIVAKAVARGIYADELTMSKTPHGQGPGAWEKESSVCVFSCAHLVNKQETIRSPALLTNVTPASTTQSPARFVPVPFVVARLVAGSQAGPRVGPRPRASCMPAHPASVQAAPSQRPACASLPAAAPPRLDSHAPPQT